MYAKRIIALILTLTIILPLSSISMLIEVFAGLSPYDQELYGKGTYTDPVDYKLLYPDRFGLPNKISAPFVKFSVVNKADNSVIGTSPDDDKTVIIVDDIPVGTTVKITNQSTVGSGTAIDMIDFQVTKDGSQVSSLQASPTALNNYELTLDSPGTYRFYLCVRDNTAKTKTDGWGNWSYNGPHKAKGLNFGKNGVKETSGTPETAGGDDFWGYWYFTFVEVKVVANNPPNADFTISYKGTDVTDNKTSPATIDPDDKSLVLEDCSVPFSPAEPITSRKWYYWSVEVGWTEIPGSENQTVVYIGDMDASLPDTGINKAFRLVVESYSGGNDYAEHTAYFKKAPPPPPPPGTADIFVYYRDKNTDMDIYPADMTTYKGVSYGTYTIHAKPDTAAYKLDAAVTPSPQVVTVDAENNLKEVIFYYIPQSTGSEGIAPTAVITGPSSRMAGEGIFFSGGSSFDPDGEIVEYIWDIPGAIITSVTNGGKNVNAWYPNTGSYDLFLTVVDNDGLIGECMTSIEITPPVPTAVIDIKGKLKENRKVTVSGENSTSPSHYPINKYTWTMTNQADARYTGTFGSDASKEMIFKKAQSYRFDLKVDNTYGLSDRELRTVTIAPDLAPVADFSVATQVLRDPQDNNYATITATNLSKSTDGDPIKKTVMFYAYDSDNDGNFDEETWYISKDGTTWTASGLTYAQLDSLDLYSLSGAGNPETFVLRTKEVGKYKFEAKTIEDIPAEDTIPSLLTAADYKTSITTTTKPLSTKVVEVINTAPSVSFEVKKKKPVDILIFTDYTGTKLNNLQTVINTKKAQLNAIGVDPNFVIVNSSKTIGTQALKKYKYVRNLHFNIKVTEGIGTNSQWTPSNPKLFDASGDVWEEIVSYEKPFNELPPFSRHYSHYQYIDTTTRSYPYESVSQNFRVYDTAGGYVDVSFSTYYNYMGYFFEYNKWSITGVGPDAQWIQDAFLGTDNKPVTSIDIDSITTIPLRADSDRYAIFISDGRSKDYSLDFGNNFAFGSLTEEIKNYINQNGFKIYTVADPKAMNTLISKEIPVDVKACDVRKGSNNYTLALYRTANDTYYFYHTKTNKPYVVSAHTFGEVKTIISPGFILMKNGTTKYFDGSSFGTIPLNNIISVKDSDSQFCAAITSTGAALVDVDKMIIKATVPDPNIVDFKIISDYAIFAAKNMVYIVNIDNGTIVGTFAQNNCTSIGVLEGIYDEIYLTITDGDSLDIVNMSTLDLYKFNIPGGVKQVFPKNGLTQWIENGNSVYGKYVLSNSGVMYRIKDTNHNHIIDSFSYTTSVFSPYNITRIIDYRSSADLYMLTADNKLILYKYINNVVSVQKNNYKIKEESIDTSGYTLSNNLNWTHNFAEFCSSRLVLLDDGTVEASYPIVTERRWSNKDERYFSEYGQSPFYTVTMPDGVSVKKVSASAVGMFILGTDNNLYIVNYTPVYGGDQSPVVSLFMSGVSDISEGYRNGYYGQAVHITKTDGSIVRRYTETLTVGGSMQIYTNTISNVKKFIGLNNGCYYLLNDGTTSYNIVSTNITMTNPTAKYITLNDLVNSNKSSRTYAAGQYTHALNDLAATYTSDPSYSTNYILLGDTVDYKVLYQDRELDPSYRYYWTYDHQSDYFENSLGLASFHGQTLNDPITTFDKVGKYTIDLKVRDNPKNNDLFDNYRLYNQRIVTATLYVHRLGIPAPKVIITPNGEYWRVEAIDAGSYDLDHISRTDKGIIAREWRWKSEYDTSWRYERMVKDDCLSTETYYIQLRVKDVEGFWSDWKEITIKNDNPPVALFTIEKSPISTNENLRVKDLSYPQSFSRITNWHWIVRKLNEDGSEKDADIQNAQFSDSNNGTGSMEGYDVNVKTDYSDAGPGIYRIYLRVKDSNGLWSDFFSMDFEVQESFKMTGFRVVKVRDLHLKDYYYNPSTGQYEDKPMDVNTMAVDYRNFGGMVDGLAKGYIFEFEIDTVNFNGDSDTIEITPHFYTCDDYLRDPEERGLYWENSYHEVLKAGEGGHAAWKTITLDKYDRTVTGENTATWRGSYLIPGTSWAVPEGTSAADARANRIDRDIIVNFEIKGFKDGEMKYDYNLKQWPVERTIEKLPYEVGDVIRYSHTKSNMDDSNVILNRP